MPSQQIPPGSEEAESGEEEEEDPYALEHTDDRQTGEHKEATQTGKAHSVQSEEEQFEKRSQAWSMAGLADKIVRDAGVVPAIDQIDGRSCGASRRTHSAQRPLRRSPRAPTTLGGACDATGAILAVFAQTSWVLVRGRLLADSAGGWVSQALLFRRGPAPNQRGIPFMPHSVKSHHCLAVAHDCAYSENRSSSRPAISGSLHVHDAQQSKCIQIRPLPARTARRVSALQHR